MNLSLEFLVGLFTSSGGNVRGHSGDLVELRRLIASGILTMDEVTLQIPSEPSRSSPDWKAYFDAFTGNTSKTHGWLKWASWSWLRCQGEPEPRYEQPYPGGKGDVYSESLLTIMECGDTAPDKLLSTLVSCSAYSAWILVPYPAEPRFYIQETISGSMLLAYRFRRPD